MTVDEVFTLLLSQQDLGNCKAPVFLFDRQTNVCYTVAILRNNPYYFAGIQGDIFGTNRKNILPFTFVKTQIGLALLLLLLLKRGFEPLTLESLNVKFDGFVHRTNRTDHGRQNALTVR